MTIKGAAKLKNSMWIANLATSMHIVNSDKAMFDIKNIKEPVKIGHRKLVYATRLSKL